MIHIEKLRLFLQRGRERGPCRMFALPVNQESPILVSCGPDLIESDLHRARIVGGVAIETKDPDYAAFEHVDHMSVAIAVVDASKKTPLDALDDMDAISLMRESERP
jgi:hypothetical protein